jgi:glucosamine--fructose-6-phosphate aminotransferase (isomerizing)
MIKEIFEQPKALRDTLAGRLHDDKLSSRKWTFLQAKQPFNKVAIVACEQPTMPD